MQTKQLLVKNYTDVTQSIKIKKTLLRQFKFSTNVLDPCKLTNINI